MNFALYISAFTLGLLGSFHCAGMCGPIALMLPSTGNHRKQLFTGKLLYNCGRLVTYISIGLILGMLGMAASLKGFQRELSVLTGVVVLVTVLLGTGKKKRVLSVTSIPGVEAPLRKKLKKLFSVKSRLSLFLIGVFNGLLPCGFVYLAAAGALSTGSFIGGATYMLLFGLGTFPVMMMISLAADFFGMKYRMWFSRVSPYIAIALALFLIYRGTDMKTDNGCIDKHKSHATINCRVE